MAERLTAAKRRYLENALLIAALELIFRKLIITYKSRQIGEFADTTSGGTPLRSISSYFDGNIPWIKSGELKDGAILSAEEYITQEGLDNSSAKIFPKGTLVVALYGANIGKTGILDIDAASNQAVCALFPKSDIVTTEFLYWFIRYKRPDFLGSSFGGAQPNISQKLLRITEVPIPPKNLQNDICNFLKIVEKRQGGDNSCDYPSLPDKFQDVCRIVAHIEALAARVNKASRFRSDAVEETKVLLQSCIDQMLKEKADTNSWKWSLLPDFVSPKKHSIKRGPFGSHLRKEFFVPSGYKVYEQKHAIYGDFKAGSYYIDEKKFQELKSFEVNPGDLIISCSGTIGKVAIVPENAEKGIINQALLKITLDTSKIDRRFFKLIFESNLIRQEVATISPGSAMKNIGSVKILKKIKFPLPSLTEQQKILVYLNDLQAQVDELHRLQAESQKELDALLPSILDRVFRGEL